jgi:DNA-binding transcriptional regulator YhcF (GntR family)
LIRISKATGVPVFKQIVDQILYMIEAGQLQDGDRLPSSRMLAASLHVNRNTVGRAYAELRDMGHVRSQRRAGMVVQGAAKARERVAAQEAAHQVLEQAVTRCLALGLSADEIATLAYHQGLHAQQAEVTLAFVECNDERAEAFANDLSERLKTPVQPLVLGHFEPSDLEDTDLVITTFFHLAEVRRLSRRVERPDGAPEVLGIVVAPHVQTLVRLASIPKNQRIGIVYSTQDQAEAIRLSLEETGLRNIEVVTDTSAEALADVNIVVVPSENPELHRQVAGKAEVIEFGNVLDVASTRMVSEVVDELRDRKQRGPPALTLAPAESDSAQSGGAPTTAI